MALLDFPRTRKPGSEEPDDVGVVRAGAAGPSATTKPAVPTGGLQTGGLISGGAKVAADAAAAQRQTAVPTMAPATSGATGGGWLGKEIAKVSAPSGNPTATAPGLPRPNPAVTAPISGLQTGGLLSGGAKVAADAAAARVSTAQPPGAGASTYRPTQRVPINPQPSAATAAAPAAPRTPAIGLQAGGLISGGAKVRADEAARTSAATPRGGAAAIQPQVDAMRPNIEANAAIADQVARKKAGVATADWNKGSSLTPEGNWRAMFPRVRPDAAAAGPAAPRPAATVAAPVTQTSPVDGGSPGGSWLGDEVDAKVKGLSAEIGAVAQGLPRQNPAQSRGQGAIQTQVEAMQPSIESSAAVADQVARKKAGVAQADWNKGSSMMPDSDWRKMFPSNMPRQRPAAGAGAGEAAPFRGSTPQEVADFKAGAPEVISYAANGRANSGRALTNLGEGSKAFATFTPKQRVPLRPKPAAHTVAAGLPRKRKQSAL